ncbi:hypothetical protein VPHD81_0080 [Vibrio phage D81]
MSMDKSAIEKIQETANIPQLIEQLNGSQVPIALAPESFRLLDLEKHQEHLSRFRGEFTTQCIPDFIEYVKKHDGEGVRCFINQDSMSAKTIFDLGTVEKPLHQEHCSKLALKKTAAFKDLLRNEGVQMSQRDLIAFIEDWNANIQAISTIGEEVSIKKAIDSIRSITVENQSSVESVQEDFGSNLTTSEKIELKNRNVQVNALMFTCVPYEGLKERVFELRISISTDRGIGMKFRMVGKEAVEEEMATEFKDLIKSDLEETKVETFIGQFS